MESAEFTEYVLFNEIASETGLLVYSYDSLTGKIVWAGASEKVTGYSKAELSEFDIKMWIGSIHPDDVSGIVNQPKIILNKKREFVINYRFKNKNNEYIMLKDTGVAFLNDEGIEIREVGRIEVLG
ncbi:MAG: PAS domain-containing protein [Ignavibacteriaceae bacterium]